MNSFETMANYFSNNPNIPAQNGYPSLTATVNNGGGGFQRSIIFALNQAIHITIYENTWNTQALIGGNWLGPHCLHITADIASGIAEHWFRQYVQGAWDFVGNDNSPYDARVAKSVELLMGAISRYFFP